MDLVLKYKWQEFEDETDSYEDNLITGVPFSYEQKSYSLYLVR
jgi:hypothetical protein